MMSEVTDKRSTPTLEEFVKRCEGKRNHRSKEDSIKLLEKEIQKYENKYKMTSSEFIERYEKGDFEMDDNYLDHELLDWEISYLTYQRLRKE
jgi:hypothetical protein